MNTSTLAQELVPLEAQLEQTRRKHEALEGELRVVEAELDRFCAERQRFDALREVCDALDKLGELKADGLFWEGIPGAKDAAGHLVRVRRRVTSFEGEIGGILEKQQSLQEQIKQCLAELDILDEEVRDAYDREEQRKEEFVTERELSSVPFRAMVMPWTKEAESERRFRRAVLVALFVCLVFGASIALIRVPIPDRADTVVEIPERLVSLVKKELAKPPPAPEPVPKQDREEPKQAKKDPEPQPDQRKPDKPPQLAADDGGASAARKKAESVGVLKFKNAFADLINETPVANLGTEARLSKSPQVRGQAVAQRSLVAMQASGGFSGGIGNAGVSRNVGNGNADRLGGGVGFTRVESAIAGLKESSRPLSDGLTPSRTDEEIQIIFDRYKAALYRIYNMELRKDPTLRGKILMRITIETSGEVSLCNVESTDLASPELVAKIVERIKRFNFGPKEGVQKMTILYPIEFFPAG